jgi:hypothetical protein
MIAGYEVNTVIGQGGMGIVYEATQLSLKRKIALKLLAAHLSDDERFRSRFRREGELQGRLEHPHIVTVHEAGESDYGLFLAMRMVRGPRLKDLVLARELNAERTVHILSPIADALDTAHEEGLIHRDIKPQNILVGGRDHAYLADFGLTKLPGEKSLTDTGQFMGTLDYVAPEQIVGESPTIQTDVYAFGAVLCECLTGSVPYLRENEAAVLYAHLSDDPPRLSEREPKLPPELDDVIARALAKEPEARQASAGELMDQVEDVLGGRRLRAIRQPVPIVPPTDHTTQPDEPGTVDMEKSTGRLRTRYGPRAIRRRRRLALAGVGAAAAIMGAAAGLLLDSGPSDARAAESAALAFDLPAGWRATEKSRPIPGLKLTDAVGATNGPQTIDAGVVRTSEPGLLPRRFRLQITGNPGERTELVRTERLEGIRNAGMTVRGSGEALAIYAFPTSAGVATVVCRAPIAQAIAADCERAAQTLRLRRGTPRALMPSAPYGTQIDDVVRALQPRRRNMRQKLANATNRYDQQQASSGAAKAYDRAVVRLRAIEPPAVAARAHAHLVRSMDATAGGYRAMVKAAVAADREGFERAKQRVRRSETQIQGGFDGLRQIGYTIV